MSERYHGHYAPNGTILWTDGDDQFLQGDVESVTVESDWDGKDWGYLVHVQLKDGRKICPDFTSYGDYEAACEAADFWRSLLGKG